MPRGKGLGLVFKKTLPTVSLLDDKLPADYPAEKDLGLACLPLLPESTLPDLGKDILGCIIKQSCQLILDPKKIQVYVQGLSKISKDFLRVVISPGFKRFLDMYMWTIRNVCHFALQQNTDMEMFPGPDLRPLWTPDGRWTAIYTEPQVEKFLSFDTESPIWQELFEKLNILDKELLRNEEDLTLGCITQSPNCFSEELCFVQKVPLRPISEEKLIQRIPPDCYSSQFICSRRRVIEKMLLGKSGDVDLEEYEEEEEDYEDDDDTPGSFCHLQKKMKLEQHTLANFASTEEKKFFGPESSPNFTEIFFRSFWDLFEFGNLWSTDFHTFSLPHRKAANEPKEVLTRLKNLFEKLFPQRNYYYELNNHASEWFGYHLFIGELDHFYIIYSCPANSWS